LIRKAKRKKKTSLSNHLVAKQASRENLLKRSRMHPKIANILIRQHPLKFPSRMTLSKTWKGFAP